MRISIWKLAVTPCVALLALTFNEHVIAQDLTANVGSGRGGSGNFDLNGQITYSYASLPRTIALRTVEPVLCADFGAATNSLRLSLRDPNGDFPIGGSFVGLTAVSYDPAARRLNLNSDSTTTVLKCRVPAFVDGSGADFLFANNFELSGIDLAVTITAPSIALVSSALNYTVVVRNLGTATADVVKVRDFYTKRPIGNPTAPGVSEGTWTCSASGSASCGTALQATGRISTMDAVIPAGSGNFLTYAVTRDVLASTQLGSNVVLAAAAFHGPGVVANDDLVGANDSQKRRVSITNNRPPEINFAGDAFDMGLEGSATLRPISFTVTDPDGDQVSTFPNAIIGNTLVFASGTTSGSAPNFVLQLVRANDDANGTSSVTVRAFDNRGGESTRTINATIAPVNDPPTVLLSGANCSGANGISTTPGNPLLLGLPTSTQARFVTCSGFISTTPGPSNESGQSVAVGAPTFAGDSIFSTKTLPSFSPTGSGVYTFSFLLNPVASASSTCVSGVATDSGDSVFPNVNSRTFRVRINIGGGNPDVGCTPAP